MITTAVTIPAIALVLSCDFEGLSVAAAAVALLVAVRVELVLDSDRMDVPTAEEATVVDGPLEIEVEASLDCERLFEVGALVEEVVERSLNDPEGLGIVVGAIELVDEVTGTSLEIRLESTSDVLNMDEVVVAEAAGSPVLEKGVVIALTVAVIVSAMFGRAPAIPSQTVYPL